MESPVDTGLEPRKSHHPILAGSTGCSGTKYREEKVRHLALKMTTGNKIAS
jgi:hypothetical protein